MSVEVSAPDSFSELMKRMSVWRVALRRARAHPARWLSGAALLVAVAGLPVVAASAGEVGGAGFAVARSAQASALGPAPVVHGGELPARELLLPAGAGTGGAYPGGGLESVSCSGPQECVAVGGVWSSGGTSRAMVATETDGVWGRPVEIAPRRNDGVGATLTVSCSGGKRCVVARVAGGGVPPVGSMRVATDTTGVWGPASRIELPVGGTLAATGGESGPAAAPGIDAVTCTGPGDCVAVGSFYASTARGYQAMAATETNGVWSRASEVALPGDAMASLQEADLDAVTCTGPGDCVAIGSYYDTDAEVGAGRGFGLDQGLQLMAVTETGGVWGRARTMMLPAGVSDTLSTQVEPTAVSCTSLRDCVAVGNYETTEGSQVMAATETGGVWGQPREIMEPAGASVVVEGPMLTSVSCTSPGDCVAVGAYSSGVEAAPDVQPMIAIETSGRWERAIEVALPADAGTQVQLADLQSVACATQAHCVAVGAYSSGSTPKPKPHPMVVSFAP